jgi:hypothetical protein
MTMNRDVLFWRGEHTLQVFENEVPKHIIGIKRDGHKECTHIFVIISSAFFTSSLLGTSSQTFSTRLLPLELDNKFHTSIKQVKLYFSIVK